MDGDIRKAKKYCLRLLSLRARSRHEIEDRLVRAGYVPEVRKGALDFLKKNGYVDDLEFAKEWIDYRNRSRPGGKKILFDELRKKGISEAVINKAFTEKDGDLDERGPVKRLIMKELHAGGTPEDVKLRVKLFRFLLRRGFDPEIVEEIMETEFRTRDHEFE